MTALNPITPVLTALSAVTGYLLGKRWGGLSALIAGGVGGMGGWLVGQIRKANPVQLKEITQAGSDTSLVAAFETHQQEAGEHVRRVRTQGLISSVDRMQR